MNRTALWLGAAVAASCVHAPAQAQNLDVGGAPGTPPAPINITAQQGIEWQQDQKLVIATGQARAVRGDVTVDADQLIAHYRKKPSPPGTPAPAADAAASATPASAGDVLNEGGSEIYQLDAIGHVHIYTPTDNAYGDKAVYNVDSDVLVLTGAHIKLTTAHDVITARDAVEYYSATHMAVARGNALIVADDGRSVAADTLVGYLIPNPPAATPGTAAAPAPVASNKPADPLSDAGKLREVDAFGHVVIHTATDTATGDRGIYLPQEQRARLGGNVHIIRGGDHLAGSDALVNLKTGVSTLLAGAGGQVAGVIVPQSAPATPPAPATPTSPTQPK